MTRDGWPVSREVTFYLVIAILLTVPVVHAIAFDVETTAGVEWEATSDGPTVYFDEARDLPSGGSVDWFPASDSVYILTKTPRAGAHYNGTADTRARIDEMNGTWSNVSQLDVTAGNLTINPDGMAQAKVAGDASTFGFKGQATVDDGTVDAYIDGTGTADVTLRTDGTQGVQYGLIDADTNEGLAVGIANAQGDVYFESVDLSAHDLSVKELGTLTIRNETEPHGLVTGADVEVRFFSEDGDTIVERSDDDGDGRIDLTGLPTDEQFVAVIDVPGYDQRTALLNDLSQQNTTFVLYDTVTPPTLEKELIVEDQTGQFDEEDTEIIIQRAINESRYEPGAGIHYRTVAGDDIGADRAYIVTLQEDARYRIRVRNGDGDVRQLGAFTPKTAGTTTLEIGSVVANQTMVDGVRYNASFENTTGGKDVLVTYNDSTNTTDTLYIEIHERGNRTNKLLANTTFVGPLGDVALSEPVPAAENETEWVVRITAERSGNDNVQAREILSPRKTVLGGMAGWLRSVLSLGLIWIVAGLFSQVNGDIGALATAGLGAMLWFVGFAPGVLGIGVVILALVTAALIFINQRRDGGL